jgi:hypothetical protein
MCMEVQDDNTGPDPHREFYAKLCSATLDFIETYGVRPVPVKLLDGGLGGINAGTCNLLGRLGILDCELKCQFLARIRPF